MRGGFLAPLVNNFNETLKRANNSIAYDCLCARVVVDKADCIEALRNYETRLDLCEQFGQYR